ncbi:hypothetical protein K1719_035321 [Acacia pycnantha]|nr:hypothetical protein K1719_035321 [Acacia pycnantha]
MYPFERFLRTLKCKIKNPRYVEGSIAEAFLVEETTKFGSYYYPPEVISRWRGHTASPQSQVGEASSSSTPAWGTTDPAMRKLWIRPIGTTEFEPRKTAVASDGLTLSPSNSRTTITS